MQQTAKLLLLALLIWLSAEPVSTSRAGTFLPAVPDCVKSNITARLLQRTTAESYGAWIDVLSGEKPATVTGQIYSIHTRFSPTLFNGQSKAFIYLKEQVRALYPASQIEEDAYTIPPTGNPWEGQTWKNLVVTIPGRLHPEQMVIMTAHFDSISPDALTQAPGADDNATGSASLLEAARILRTQPLDRTVRLIWFSGEEQGLIGSSAYVHDPAHDLSGVVGMVNIDVIGYDSNNDRCFEIHVSKSAADPSAAASNAVGQCLVRTITNYGLNLKYDYFTSGATDRSDHASFWSKNIGAVLVAQNYFQEGTTNGCAGKDNNPYHHTIGDTPGRINLPYAFSIHRAALAAVVDLAGPLPGHSTYLPLLRNSR